MQRNWNVLDNTEIELVENDEYVTVDPNKNCIIRSADGNRYKVEYDNVMQFRSFRNWISNQTVQSPQENQEGQESQTIDLVDFYKYCRLKKVQLLAYEMKNECLAQIIQISEKNQTDISVLDITETEIDFNTGEKKVRSAEDDTCLIAIDIPGYSAPYIVHSRKATLNRLLGRDEQEKLPIESSSDYKNSAANHLPFKLTDEQIEFILNADASNIRSPKARESIIYMHNSIARKRSIERNKKASDIENRSEDFVKENEKEDTEKRLIRKPNSSRDIQFIDKLCEEAKAMGINISEECKAELLEKSGRSSGLSQIFKCIENYCKEKESNQGENTNSEKIAKEKAIKMYIYMKLGTNRFWGLTDKKKRDEYLENGFDEEKFGQIIQGMNEGKSPDDLYTMMTGRKKVRRGNDSKSDTKKENMRKVKSEEGKEFEGYTDSGIDGKSIAPHIQKGIIERIEAKKEKLRENIAKIEMIIQDISAMDRSSKTDEAIKNLMDQIEIYKSNINVLEEVVYREDAAINTHEGNINENTSRQLMKDSKTIAKSSKDKDKGMSIDEE